MRWVSLSALSQACIAEENFSASAATLPSLCHQKQGFQADVKRRTRAGPDSRHNGREGGFLPAGAQTLLAFQRQRAYLIPSSSTAVKAASRAAARLFGVEAFNPKDTDITVRIHDYQKQYKHTRGAYYPGKSQRDAYTVLLEPQTSEGTQDCC